MAKPAARSPSSPSSHLTLRVLVLVVVVALVAAGVVAGWAEWRIRTATPASGADDLESAVRAQSRADDQRLEELTLVAGRLARRADLPLGAEEDDDEADEEESAAAGLRALIGSLEDVLDERQVELIVLRGGGEMALRVGAPADAAREMAVSALMDQALDEGRASGVWSFGERLYRVAAERVEAEGETLGALAVADLVGRATAIEARAVSRAEAVYLLALDGSGDGGEGATVVASTLDQAAGARLVAALADAGVLGEVLAGNERRDPVDVPLGDSRYRAMAAPLTAGAGGASAARVALIETGTGDHQLRMVQAAALAGGLGALLLGLVGAPLVTRGSGSASKEVAEAARAARAGDLAGAARHAVPAPLALYFQETAEKRALEAVVASLGRTDGLGEGGEGQAEGHPARSKGAVLAVEMPGYARTPSDQDPREVSERLGRDVMRLRRVVTARNGRLEATLGHRALAVFEGERAGARAVGAAAEAMKALATPENAFDEPTPPAAAVATGTFVAGGPEGARTVSGLPVQQTESLLREASSGDLIVAKQAFRELEGELSAGGVEVAAQRGLLTPQPVYLLDADKAARAASALGSADGAPAAGLSGLAAGTVLGDRFTLVDRRNANPAWVRYLARDGELDALVTVRTLRPGTVVDLGAFEAFDGPLQLVQRAVDPAVERVIASGESDGVPFLAAERVEGPTLERLLDGLRAERRPLGAAAALRIARTVAAGLAAVHAAGVPHGALRPASVSLDPRGHARLTGLGLALVLPSPGIDPAVDRALGPARYRAPERLAGDEATPAADVYAAGVLLTELFSGRVSDDGAPPEAPDATELPDGLAPVLARCLEHDPAARYPDGAALAEALEPVRAEIVSR